MQAIVTKYLPCTNTKGSRIKAFCDAGSITIPYPHELSGMAVYRKAAEMLLEKLEWDKREYGKLLGGGAPQHGTNIAYVFVFDNPASR